MTARDRWVRRLILFVVVFAVHATSPNAVVSDAVRTIPVAESIVHRHTISLDHYRTPTPAGAEPRWGGGLPLPGYAVNVVDGHLYPMFPWTVSLFAVPVVVAVDGAAALGIGEGVEEHAVAENTDWPYQVVTMSYVVALATVFIFEAALLALASITDERRRRRLAYVAAGLFSFGTGAWSMASRSSWQHGPSMLFGSIALWLALKGEDDPNAVRWLGIPLAAAFAVRPTNAIPVVAFSIWMLVRHRRVRTLVAYAAGAAAVAIPFVLVNLSAWGRLLPPYYAGSRLEGSSSVLEALAGNLVSPARGLLVFSPFLVLAAVGFVLRARRHQLRSLDVTLACCVGAHWIVISTFPHWWGGDSYGPRLFLDMVPFLVVLAVPVLAELARPGASRAAIGVCTALAAVSVLINFEGAYLRSSLCWNNRPDEVDAHPDRLWDWSDPQFLRGGRRLLFGPDRGGELVRGGVAATGCPETSEPT